MTTPKRLAFSLVITTFLFAIIAQGQTPQADAVNVTTTSNRVHIAIGKDRFETRIEVTNSAGEVIFESGILSSSSFDWQMRDSLGQRVKAGDYTLTITYRTPTGKLLRRTESVTVPAQTGAQTVEEMPQENQEVTPKAIGPISGEGTSGKIAKFNGANSITSSTEMTELSNKIGIGTATPNNKLHVVGKIELGATSGTGVNPTLVNPNNLTNYSQVNFYPASGTNTNMSFAVIPKGTGVANNRAQFSVFNTDYIANSTNYEFASLRARGTDFVFGTGRSGTGVVRPLVFGAGILSAAPVNNNQLVLATNGNVGINVGTPIVGRLHVVAASGQDGVYATSVNGNAVNGVAPTTGVRGESTGSGDGVYGTSATGNAGYFEGNVLVTGLICAANHSCISDERLKQGIRGLNYGLNQVLRLRPVSWHWKTEPEGKLQMGLVAQEVENVMPEMVLRGKDATKPLGLNYMSLLPVMVKAAQEQQALIQQQQKLIEQLQQRLARVERTVKKRRAFRRSR